MKKNKHRQSMIDDKLNEAVPINVISFLSQWAKFFRNLGHEYHEAFDAGVVAYLVCVRDGQLVDGMITRPGQIFIRREMSRASAPASRPQKRNIPDYGYIDGRKMFRGPRTIAKTRQQRRCHRLMRAGRCRICGKNRDADFSLCIACHKKRLKSNNAYRLKLRLARRQIISSRSRGGAKSSGKVRFHKIQQARGVQE